MRLGSVARPQELRVVLWNFNEVISSQSQDRVQFTWSASANQRPRTAFYSQNKKMTECRYFVAVKIWDRQSCVSNQWPDTLILTNQNSANEWKFPESDQTALIVLLSAWIVRKQPKISEAAMWCTLLDVTCLLRVLIVQFAPLVSVPDAQVGQEVHKERTVEILAELVENKPGNKERLLDFFGRNFRENSGRRVRFFCFLLLILNICFFVQVPAECLKILCERNTEFCW